MSYSICKEIKKICKKDLDYDIPFDSYDEGLYVNYIFSGGDSKQINKIVNHLLRQEDFDITNTFWRYFPFNTDGLVFDGLLKDFAEKRKCVLEEHSHYEGNIYNRTKDIPFAKGIITPLRNGHRQILVEEITKEMDAAPNSHERYELSCFCDSVKDANRQHGEKPSFCILNTEGELVAYISLTEGGYFGFRPSSNTFNLEYYTIPKFRRMGLLKDGLKALLQAIHEGKIHIIKNDPMFTYNAEVQPLKVRLINALVYKDNEASIRSVESLGLFEKMGLVKLAENDNEIKEVVCYTMEV